MPFLIPIAGVVSAFLISRMSYETIRKTKRKVERRSRKKDI